MKASGKVRRLLSVRRPGQLLVAALCLVLALGSAGVAGLASFQVAAADNAIEGRPVDATTTQTIMIAALSCPALTGPRLAAALMANSGMDASSSTGVAGLAPAVFAKWAPWSKASATDPTAGIYALAHYLCALSGEVRQAGVKGDPWNTALAAYHSGVDAVSKAGGVPPDARTYVDTVAGYAVWYARQDGFTAGVAPSGSAQSLGVRAAAVPDADLAAIRAAGSICAEVTPPMVAAQVMASSGFDPNLRAATQAMGIAQFLPDLWGEYASSPNSSPWDPATAIGTLGRTMCDLTHQLSMIDPKPYQLALAAFRIGPTPIRQAGGIPHIPLVQQFVDQVVSDTAVYAKDTRLAAVAPATSHPSAPASPSPSPSPAVSPTVAPTTHAPTTTPSRTGPIKGVQSLCVDIPSGNTTNGTQLQIWNCNGYAPQQWTVGADGTIRGMGKCMDVKGAGTTKGTAVELWSCNGSRSQQWVNQSGILKSPVSNLCLDANATNLGPGTLLQIWTCLGGVNQHWQLP